MGPQMFNSLAFANEFFKTIGKKLSDMLGKIPIKPITKIAKAIRTVAEGHTEEDLHSDINYLVSIWEDVLLKFKTLPSPSLLHSDLNIIFRTIRDLFSTDIRKLIVDDKQEYKKVRHFVRSFLPRYGSVLENYTRKEHSRGTCCT